MRIRLYALIVAVAIQTVCMGQQPASDPVSDVSATPPDAPETLQVASGLIELPGMTISMADRQIVLQSEVCLRAGMLELLVCGFETKEHESVLRTRVRPSDIHAALLLLGLRPGTPARWFQIDDAAPVAMPPRGAGLDIRLKWTDVDGKAHDVPAGQWLRRVGTDEVAPPVQKWIFVGSNLLSDNVYWADGSGEIISVSNFAASVIDVPFASSSTNADLLFVAETEQIPPLGTAVQVVISLTDQRPLHARAWVTVNRLGELFADNRPVTPAELEQWAMDYIREYPKGQVIVRSDPLALGAQVQAAMMAVRMGGVWEITESRFDQIEPILPRTPAQAAEALDHLRAELSEEGLYGDPHADAAVTLAQIEREMAELERLKALWGEYAAHVRQTLDEHPKADEPDPEASP
jgi:hypothetical protein